MAKFVAQPFIRLRFFNRIQILTLNILDQRNFQRLGIIKCAHNRRYMMNLRALRRTPAPFARDDLVFTFKWAHNNRLDNTVPFQALRQFLKRVFGKISARLMRVRFNVGDSNRRQPRRQ